MVYCIIVVSYVCAQTHANGFDYATSGQGKAVGWLQAAHMGGGGGGGDGWRASSPGRRVRPLDSLPQRLLHILHGGVRTAKSQSVSPWCFVWGTPPHAGSTCSRVELGLCRTPAAPRTPGGRPGALVIANARRWLPHPASGSPGGNNSRRSHHPAPPRIIIAKASPGSKQRRHEVKRSAPAPHPVPLPALPCFPAQPLPPPAPGPTSRPPTSSQRTLGISTATSRSALGRTRVSAALRAR